MPNLPTGFRLDYVLTEAVEFELPGDLDWVSIKISEKYLWYDDPPRRVNRDPDGKFRLPVGFDLAGTL